LPLRALRDRLLRAIDAQADAHRPKFDRWSKDRDDFPSACATEDVVTRHRIAPQAWRNVSLQQLNADLAVQLHSLSLKNQTRKVSLRRLYRSLRNMAIVFSAILLLFALFTMF
jgi:hypothetical protein